MPKSPLHFARRDIGNFLVHWTRDRLESKDFQQTRRVTAFDVLLEILKSGCIRGSSSYIRGGHACVCFTEAPIAEMVSIFSASALTMNDDDRLRYLPYGIGLTKQDVFEKGGRPVIYGPEADYDVLPSELEWRHCKYDPTREIDFTWEREWRIKTDKLALESEADTRAVAHHGRGPRAPPWRGSMKGGRLSHSSFSACSSEGRTVQVPLSPKSPVKKP